MDWPRYLKIAIYTGLFAIPFVGLIVADFFFFPFITGKGFAFRIIIEIVFALWLILALWSPEYRPTKSVALILGGLFVVSLLVSAIFGANPVKSIWSNFERMEGWVLIVHLAMYVVALTSMLRTEILWRRFFDASIIAASLVSLYGVFQLLGAFTINQGGVRVDGTFGNATYLAVYMLIHVFITILALMRWTNGSRLRQVAYSIALVLELLMVFYSATRGTILGLVGGLFIAGIAFLISKGADARARKIGIGLVILVVVMVGGFFAVKDTAYVKNHEILSRIASISLAEGQTRFAIWDMALKGFAERPIFGWGQENFNYIFNKYYHADLYAQEPWFDRAHDVPLDWLVAGGIIGALLYLSLYGVILWYLWKPGNQFDPAERALLTGLLAGYAFHNVFVFDNLMSYLMFMAILSYVTVRAVPPKAWGTPVPTGGISVAAPVIGVMAVVVFYFVNVPGIVSATDLIEGIKPHTEGITKNFDYFKDAASHSGLGAQEVREQLLQFALQVRQLNAGDQQFQLDVATYARDQFLAGLDKTPNDARLQVFIGSFLRQYGDFAGSKEHLDKALALSPQKQTILFEQGALAVSQNDFASALQVFKKAYELDTRYDQARIFYAAAAIHQGNTQLADSLLIPRYGTNTPPDDYILQAYLDIKDFGKVIAIAKARTVAEPTNVQRWIQLGAAYYQAGDRANAVLALKQAEVVDPTFKTQGDVYIQQLESGQELK